MAPLLQLGRDQAAPAIEIEHVSRRSVGQQSQYDAMAPIRRVLPGVLFERDLARWASENAPVPRVPLGKVQPRGRFWNGVKTFQPHFVGLVRRAVVADKHDFDRRTEPLRDPLEHRRERRNRVIRDNEERRLASRPLHLPPRTSTRRVQATRTLSVTAAACDRANAIVRARDTNRPAMLAMTLPAAGP
jgi:hypothetical protein